MSQSSQMAQLFNVPANCKTRCFVPELKYFMPHLPVVVSYIRSRTWHPDIIVGVGDALALQQEGGQKLNTAWSSS
jgi:hypothetical protein